MLESEKKKKQALSALAEMGPRAGEVSAAGPSALYEARARVAEHLAALAQISPREEPGPVEAGSVARQAGERALARLSEMGQGTASQEPAGLDAAGQARLSGERALARLSEMGKGAASREAAGLDAVDQARLAGERALARLAEMPTQADEQGRNERAELMGRIGQGLRDLSQMEALPDARAEAAEARLGETAGKALEGVAQHEAAAALHMVKNSLNGGEMAPGMGARFDQQRWQTGCHELLNMVPLPCGGVTKRPGFEWLGNCQENVRIYPFIFKASEARMLEFYIQGNACKLAVWTSEGQRLATSLSLPFTADKLPDVCFCQCGDVIYYAHPDLPPGKIMRYGDSDWRWQTLRFTPEIASPNPPVCQVIGWWGNGYQGAFETQIYVATAVDAESGEESAASRETVVNLVPPLSADYYMSISVEPVPGASEYRIYRKSAGVFGFIGRIIPNEDGTLPILEDKGYVPDTADTPPAAKNPFFGQNNYPSLVFMHQQRLGFASSNLRPLTIWLSQSGNFESLASSQPPDDDDAIEATLAASQVNRILWCVSDRSGLAIGTEGGEWLLRSTEGSAMTPQDLSFEPQTWHGSQPGLAPVRAGDSLLYVQRGGVAVRSIGYSFQDDKYTSQDLSLLARHILRHNPITSWAWQPEPYGVIWCSLANGQMAGLTFLAEHEVIAWHRHETDGQIRQLAAIPGSDGAWQLWAIVKRNGLNAIERLAPFYEGIGQWKHTDRDQPIKARVTPCISELQTQAGSSFLLARKINAVKVRVINSMPFKAQVTGQNTASQLTDGQSAKSDLMTVPARGADFAQEADWLCPLAAGLRENARLTLICDGPQPVTILGLITIMELAEEA